MYKKWWLLVCTGYIVSLSAVQVTCEHDSINDTLDLNHIEPLTCSSYADLIPHEGEDNAVLIARLVSSAHGTQYIHYVDAHAVQEALFNSHIPTGQHAPKILFNPVNNVPLVENITYFALYNDHATYVGTLTDVYNKTPAGECIRALIDVHHNNNALERAYAQYTLAHWYHREQNMSAALYWYTKVLRGKSDEIVQHQVWYALGSLYEVCSDIPDHAINALTYYTHAAECTADPYVQGAALLALGNWYNTYNHDTRTAVDYYTKASSCSDPAIQAHAYTALGDIYRIGSAHFPKNYASAQRYYDQALHAAPDSVAQTSIWYGSATMYYHAGFGIEKDYAQAAALFEQVARSSDTTYHIPAAVALGELYRIGGYGVTADAHRASAWYSKVIDVAEKNSSYTRMATFGLAELYRTQDRVKAYTLYNQVLATCTQGDCLQSMVYNGLASLYCFSCSQIPADYTKAHEYYTQAFNQTDNRQARAVAAQGLATLYYHGVPGSARDVGKAVDYYEYLTEQSDDLFLQAHAHQVVGELLLHGYGTVRSDLEAAITHLQYAAQQKINVQAQHKAHDLLQEIHEQSLSTASRVRKALRS
ncbi:MAG: tetratricopeptide repeat protein [Candidatus Babeliales bacterium]